MNTADNHRRIGIRTIGKGSRTPGLIAGLLGIWEASVRASHHFVIEADIRSLRPQAEAAIRHIETLWVVDRDGVSIGFAGIQSRKIEMLFLHPDHFWKGIGKMLIQKALSGGILRADGLPNVPPRQHRRPGQPVPHPEDETDMTPRCSH